MQKTIFATRLEATNWRSTVRKAALIAFFISSVIVAFSQFTPGNLAVSVATASANNTTGSIIELNTTSTGQTAIQTIAIDGTTGPNAMRFSGSATSTMYLANSADGTQLCFTGALTTNTSSNINTITTRGVGVINALGTFSVGATYTGASGQQTRGATTLNNTAYFIGDQSGFYTNGATTASPAGNIRSVKPFGGSVYAMTSSTSTPHVGIISAATGGTYTALPGLPNGTTSGQDFYLVSSGSNGSTFDVLYIMSATSATAGTIAKYSLVSGSWVANGTYSTGVGGFGLAASWNGTGTNLYITTGLGATTANTARRIVDAAGYNATINVSATPVVLHTAAVGTILKGIAFAPVATATPNIALSSPSQVGAGSVFIGAVDHVISNFEAAVTTSNASLTALSFVTAGTYITSDVTNFKLYYNSSANTFAGASQIGSTQSSASSGSTITFSSLSTTISAGSTGYFFITASVAGSATVGNTIQAAANPTLTFASGTPTGTIALGGVQTIAAATATVTLSSTATGALSVPQFTTNAVLYRADVTVGVTSATLTDVSLTTAGTYNASDLVNFKLWYSADATFTAGDVLLATKTTGLAAGAQAFSGLSQTFGVGTGYLFLTADVACNAFIGSTISVSAPSISNFTFTSITPTGALFAGDVQTIAAGVAAPANVTAQTASGNGTSGQVAVNWTVPTCYSEIMIVAATATNTGVPTGNGSAYTASSTFGAGTALGNGFVVFKGDAATATVTGLTNGTNYSFKIFTRYNNTWSAGVEVTTTAFIQLGLTEILVPQFFQGNTPTNANRLPYSFRVRLTGLAANTTYQYVNQVRIAADGLSTNGAGNCIFPSSPTWLRSTSPAFGGAGNFGTITTDASGEAEAWFITEPSGNSRFVPGNQVIMSIRLNDGAGGTNAIYRAFTTSTITVIDLGTGVTNATAIRGTSNGVAKDFVAIYDNVTGTGRPISCTPIEDDGVANTTANSYASFYGTSVNGVAGAWGTLIPNNLANGVRRIESRSFTTGQAVCSYTDSDGTWTTGSVNTVSPSSGTTALVIATTDAPLDCAALTLDHTNISQTVPSTMAINSNDNIMSNFRIASVGAATSLNGISFVAGGTFNAGDVTAFDIYTSTSPSFPGGAPLATFDATGIATGGTVSLTFAQAISAGNRYFWITADFGASGSGNTVIVPALGNGAFSFNANASINTNTILAGGTMTLGTPTATIAIANGGLTAGSITQGTINNAIYRLDVTVGVTSTQLNTINITTAGTYVAGDLSNIKLWYSTNTTFSVGTSVLLATKTTGLGAGVQSFTGLTQNFTIGTGYLYVTVDAACAAVVANAINVGAVANTDLTFSSGSATGSGTAGSSYTFNASTPVNVTGATATATGVSGTVAINWTAPTGCYDEVLIVAAPATNTGVPTGDGSAYTGNLSYSVGTALGNGFVVYEGTVAPQSVTGLTNGTAYFFRIFTRNESSWSAGVEVSATPTVTPTLTEVIVPQFIQGINGTNATRIPYAYRVTINNLTPNATYRYFNQVVIPSDGTTGNGAGNVIFATPAGFTSTSSPGLSTAGTYAEFTANSGGSYTGWFITEPTGNATRFIPGTQVQLRIMLNNGAGGTTVANRVTTTSTATVINFATTAGPNNGSGVYGLSSATARNFVVLYDNVAGTGRPLTATFAESDGSAASNFAPFYTTNVQGVAGAWGAIIPNNNANGLRRIEQRSISDGSLVGCIGLDTDGVWPSGANTVNPTAGTTALVISNTDAALDAVSGVNYYIDADGDGFGAGTAIVLCSNPGAGYSLFNTDCNDSNVAINPSASEICGNSADDDCDSFIDEGCSGGPVPSNDSRANASVRVASGFPACSNIFGNLLNASNSTEALSVEPLGSGQDVWYTFVATTNGARIQATTTLNDLVLELQTSAGVLVDTENANGVGGTEVLVVNNLTPGATYFVAVRNFNTLAAGSFTLCISSLVASDPDNGTTFNNLCSSFKCDWNGAQSFSVTFTNGANSYTASSSSTSIPFSAFGGLQYNTVYQVTITSTFIQNDGTGSNPTTVVVVSPAYTVTIAQHLLTSLRSIDRCPTTRPVSAFISTDKFVCGAISWDWEFVEVNPLNPSEVISVSPTVINSGSSSRFIRINQLPTAEPGDRYRVRVRPVFASGPGAFTAGYEELCVAGAASMEVEEGTAVVRERSLIETISEEMTVYPNPNRGEVFTVQAAGLVSEQVFVRVLDVMGKEVYSTGYSVDGVLNAMIQMDRTLSAGVYMIELIDGDSRMVERMIVE